MVLHMAEEAQEAPYVRAAFWVRVARDCRPDNGILRSDGDKCEIASSGSRGFAPSTLLAMTFCATTMTQVLAGLIT